MMRFLSRSLAAPVLVLALLGLCLGTGTASAQVPYDMSYQGRLTDAVGAPLIGPVNLQMRIYDVISGGSPLYIEDHIAVVVDDVGAFSVRLGAGSSLLGTFNTALFAGVNRYLEVVVDGAALTPRLIIGSVPYAMHADNAASAQAAADAAQTTADAAQVRVIGSCPADSSIRSIGADGSVTCEADDDNDTTLDEATVVSIVASNGFSTGAHTVNTDTTLDEAQVDAFVANNGFAESATVASNAANIAALEALHQPPSLRFIPCTNGMTVGDSTTGLLWERKTTNGDVHDVGKTFSWSDTGTAPDGTAYTVFLTQLNAPPGFAGDTDWRLPSVSELQTLLTGPAVLEAVNASPADPSSGQNSTGQSPASTTWPTIDSGFSSIGGPTAGHYHLSSSSNADDVFSFYGIHFGAGPDWLVVRPLRKSDCFDGGPIVANYCVARAVRTGSCAP